MNLTYLRVADNLMSGSILKEFERRKAKKRVLDDAVKDVRKYMYKYM